MWNRPRDLQHLLADVAPRLWAQLRSVSVEHGLATLLLQALPSLSAKMIGGRMIVYCPFENHGHPPHISIWLINLRRVKLAWSMKHDTAMFLKRFDLGRSECNSFRMDCEALPLASF